MSEQQRQGSDGLGIWISRGSLVILAGAVIGGGSWVGLAATGLLGHEPAAVAQLQDCRRAEDRLSELVRRYEKFAEEAVPVLQTSDNGRMVTQSAGLPLRLSIPKWGGE